MGFAGLSFWHLVTVLVVVVLVFGTKRLGSIGSDLGAAVKGFRQAMASEDEPRAATSEAQGREAVEAAPDKQGPQSGTRA